MRLTTVAYNDIVFEYCWVDGQTFRASKAEGIEADVLG